MDQMYCKMLVRGTSDQTMIAYADEHILFAAGDCILVRGEGEKQPFVSFHKALITALTELTTARGDVLCG